MKLSSEVAKHLAFALAGQAYSGLDLLESELDNQVCKVMYQWEQENVPVSKRKKLLHDFLPTDCRLAVLDQVFAVKLDELSHDNPPGKTTVASLEPVWPAPLCEPAYYGLAGKIVRAIEPTSEADPAGLLLTLLVAFGNAIGRPGHWLAEMTPHSANLFVVLVGRTAKARKGTGLARVLSLLWEAVKDAELHGGLALKLGTGPALNGAVGKVRQWLSDCQMHGLASGEGLIFEVRDAVQCQKKNKITGQMETVTVDPGVEDKRRLIELEEFAGLLAVMARDGNTISSVLRLAWDGKKLQNPTKNSPCRATGAHTSIVGHITLDEVRRNLDRTEAGSGFGNRFIFFCVRRSKKLPRRVKPSGLGWSHLAKKLLQAVQHGMDATELQLDEEAGKRWDEWYCNLEEHPGLYGAITARAEPQVMRLAMIYALMDSSEEIRLEHLEAALEVWRYADESARHIFGNAVGDPIADTIVQALKSRGRLTRTEISELFKHNVSAVRIARALTLLEQHGLGQMVKEKTGGRDVEAWYPAKETKETK